MDKGITWLSVPFSKKDAVKKNGGAIFDFENKVWYVKDYNVAKFEDFLPRKISFDLVPATCWHSNLRSVLKKEEWDRLKKFVYKDCSYRCDICFGKFGKIQDKKHSVEAHELWSYDDVNKIQKLDRIMCLCPDCHLSHHIGFANTINKKRECYAHIKSVYSLNDYELRETVSKAFKTFEDRSNYDWIADISWLENISEELNIDISRFKVNV